MRPRSVAAMEARRGIGDIGNCRMRERAIAQARAPRRWAGGPRERPALTLADARRSRWDVAHRWRRAHAIRSRTILLIRHPSHRLRHALAAAGARLSRYRAQTTGTHRAGVSG